MGLFVIALIFMIFMHELSHYHSALTGMKVTEFFCRFRASTLVVPQGRDRIRRQRHPRRCVRPNHRHEQPRSGRSGRRATVVPGKSWPRKMLVVSAGSAMHFIMAIVLLAVLAFFYNAQNDDGAWQVSRTSQASAAAGSASNRVT